MYCTDLPIGYYVKCHTKYQMRCYLYNNCPIINGLKIDFFFSVSQYNWSKLYLTTSYKIFNLINILLSGYWAANKKYISKG